jgi:hypothetical protein
VLLTSHIPFHASDPTMDSRLIGRRTPKLGNMAPQCTRSCGTVVAPACMFPGPVNIPR